MLALKPGAILFRLPPLLFFLPAFTTPRNSRYNTSYENKNPRLDLSRRGFFIIACACLQHSLHACSILFMPAAFSSCMQYPLLACSILFMPVVSSSCMQHPLRLHRGRNLIPASSAVPACRRVILQRKNACPSADAPDKVICHSGFF